MSKEIETLVKGETIHSVAFQGKYILSNEEKKKEYSYSEYFDVLKGFWEDYLKSGESPRLLELPISENGLIIETLHYIAPAQWSLSKTPLSEERELLLYWLKSNTREIKAKISKESFKPFNRELEAILRIHLAAKKE